MSCSLVNAKEAEKKKVIKTTLKCRSASELREETAELGRIFSDRITGKSRVGPQRSPEMAESEMRNLDGKRWRMRVLRSWWDQIQTKRLMVIQVNIVVVENEENMAAGIEVVVLKDTTIRKKEQPGGT